MSRRPFIPQELPLPDDEINQLNFVNELIDANKYITEYQTLIHVSPIDASLLTNPIMLKEAVQSTKIEGTQATVDQVLEVNVNARKSNDDTREVLNYFEAILEGKYLLNELPLSTRLFKRLHHTLLSHDVRGASRNPGQYRKTQVYVGPPNCTIETATFVPPSPELVTDYINNLEIYINEPRDNYNSLIRIAIIHAQFETIHPFLDGNGRIGRILIPLYLYSKKVIDSPNFFLSDTLERDKHKYYRYLNDVRFQRDWNQWIKFFLECIIMQSKNNIHLINAINKIYSDDKLKLTSFINSTNAIKIYDAIFESPIFKVKTLSNKTGLSGPTCRRILSIMEKNKLIFSNDRTRSKTYYYYNLLDKLR